MLTRWDPFRDLLDIRRAMDRMMEGNYYGPETYQLSLAMPMDVCETQDAFEIDAAMPGVKPDDIEITMEGNTLTIRGQMKTEEEQENKTYHMHERREGTFVRSVTLPTNVNANKIEANYEDGILHLKAPKSEEAKPKRIQVHSSSSSRMIEGQSKSQKSK
jgi:HSP20 family protein